jgi:hypothetical protein
MLSCTSLHDSFNITAMAVPRFDPVAECMKLEYY